MSRQPLLVAESLRRVYGNRVAVHDLSLSVDRGQVVGLLGPNGAGKSTTLQMLSGCLAPTRGSIRVAGRDLVAQPELAKTHLGFLPEQPPLYRDLTVDEYLDHCARLRGLTGRQRHAARERTKARCGLVADGRRLIAQLSKGYQQRVGIAQAVLHSPPLVILDEPTIGLDPNQIREIRKLIIDLGRDHAVVLSSHILSEVEATCGRVLILSQGRTVFGERLDRGEDGASRMLVCRFARPPGDAPLLALPGVMAVERLAPDRVRLRHGAANGIAETVARAALERGWGLRELTPERPTLEQLFVDLTCRDEL